MIDCTNIQWFEMQVPLSDLKPFERNPRFITESQFSKLKASIREDGYHSRILATHDLRIIGGHQRTRALKELGYIEITVLCPAEPITDEAFQRILLRDNHTNGMFDMNMLANDFDLEFLRDLGLHEVMTIAPEGDDEPRPSGKQVCCPECGSIFPTKSNVYKGD